jgi:hypothetical protein
MMSVSELFPVLAASVPMPGFDPAGYPLPEWLLQILFNVTLALHLAAVYFTLGSCLLYLWCRARGGEHNLAISRTLGSCLPLGMSYLVTLGIPPLLFTQVIYGQQFYSSSVLMAGYWIQVPFVVILAYLCFYTHKLTRDSRPGIQTWLILAAVPLMFYVGFIYSNNVTLSMLPEKWLAVYNSHPDGFVLSHGESSVHARLLLFLAPVFCVPALALLFIGAFWKDTGSKVRGDVAHRLALGSYWLGTILTALGLLLVSRRLPPAILDTVLTLPLYRCLLASSVVLLVLSAVVVSIAVYKATRVFAVLASLLLVGALISLLFLRDFVRREYLKPFFDPAAVPVVGQWGTFFLFLVIAVAGIAFLVVLGLRLRKEGQTAS